MKEIMHVFVYWTLMCIIIVPILNLMSKKKLMDGFFFVYFGGIAVSALCIALWVLTEVIL